MNRHLPGLIGIALLSACGTSGQNLAEMSFEDFMQIKVLSASKSLKEVSRTPAAVYVLTRDEIRRSGATNLPEALRLVPGVEVAQITGVTWAIAIRGSNNVNSNKLLVLIDGVTVYNPLMSGVVWSEQSMLLDDIERIEVIRGPGATMWGANAVNGVINVITRRTGPTPGGTSTVVAGSGDPLQTRLRYEHSGKRASWRIWGQYSLYEQLYPQSGIPRLDPWPTVLGGFRTDISLSAQDKLTVQGEVRRYEGRIRNLFSGGNDGSPNNGTDGYIMARWEHVGRRGDSTVLQLHEFANSLDAGYFKSQIRTFDLDFHHTFRVSEKHDLMLGAGMRSNSIRTAGTSDFFFDPAKNVYGIYNIFAQDDWTLIRDRLSAEIGIKLERFEREGLTFDPTARIIWTPSRRQDYWVAFSHAVRVPSHVDYAIRATLSLPELPLPVYLQGSETVRPEAFNALEVGARFRLRRNLLLDLALFSNDYDRLISYQPAGLAMTNGQPVLRASTVNGMTGFNRGGELTFRWDPGAGIALSGSYSHLYTEDGYEPGFDARTAFALPSFAPKHQWQIHASRDFKRRWSLDGGYFRSSQMAHGLIPAYGRLDVRIARRFGESAEIGLLGKNLLRAYHLEYPSDLVYRPEYLRRSVAVMLRWSF